ncbi:uroporphyrinogen decarboxylase [soil metagenome]
MTAGRTAEAAPSSTEAAHASTEAGARAWIGEQRFLAACRREPGDTTPIWFMRQAGRASPGYERMRERYSVMEIATTPELCAEASLLPVAAFGVDAAVLFADIMLPLVPMGVSLELTAEGPIIERPLRSAADVACLRRIEPAKELRHVTEAIGILRRELDGHAAVIGLAGGPFTLAAYLIEGRPSRDQSRAKALMYGEPATWHTLLELLADVTAGYLQAQIDAGAHAVQLFDSWAGSLSAADYTEYVAPHARRILRSVTGAATIHFGTGTEGLLEVMAEAGGDVIGVDSRQSLAAAWARVAHRGIQGNLDGARLLAGWEATKSGAVTVLAEAAGRPGHIFNLGHGIAPETDPSIVRRLVELVHQAGVPGTATEAGG